MFLSQLAILTSLTAFIGKALALKDGHITIVYSIRVSKLQHSHLNYSSLKALALSIFILFLSCTTC